MLQWRYVLFFFFFFFSIWQAWNNPTSTGRFLGFAAAKKCQASSTPELPQEDYYFGWTLLFPAKLVSLEDFKHIKLVSPKPKWNALNFGRNARNAQSLLRLAVNRYGHARPFLQAQVNSLSRCWDLFTSDVHSSGLMLIDLRGWAVWFQVDDRAILTFGHGWNSCDFPVSLFGCSSTNWVIDVVVLRFSWGAHLVPFTSLMLEYDNSRKPRCNSRCGATTWDVRDSLEDQPTNRKLASQIGCPGQPLINRRNPGFSWY